MINVQPTTEWDRENRPKNYSSILSDDQWFSMANELGEVNDRMNESWSLEETFNLVSKFSLSGDWQFATLNEYQKVFDYFEAQ